MVDYIPKKIPRLDNKDVPFFKGKVYQFDRKECKMLPAETSIPVEGNILINGVTRYGKTFLTGKLYELLEKENTQSIIFEVRSDYLKKYYQPGDKVLTYSNIEGYSSFMWNIIEEIRSSADPKKEIDSLADYLIDCKGSGVQNDAFWINSAKEVFKACLYTFYQKNGYVSNKEVFDFIVKSDVNEIREHILCSKEMAYVANTILSPDDPKMVHSILSFLRLPISKIGGNFRSDSGKDTLRSFINGEYKRLFIVFDNKYAESQSNFIAFFLRRIVDSKTGRPDKQRHTLMLLDEISILGKDFGLLEGATLGLGTSSLQIIAITQSIGKLYNICNVNNTAQNVSALLSGFATQICFNSSDPESENHFLTPFGNAVVRTANVTGIASIDIEDKEVPFYSLASKLDVGEFIFKTTNFPTQIISIFEEK